MQIRGEAAERGGLFVVFFSQYLILFANIMGSEIKKYAGGSMRGVYDPFAGVTTQTRSDTQVGDA